jgi:methionyl aminopeptidase
VGYHGYRHASCISVNHVICHGVPGDKALRDGDLLNIDLVASRRGWHGDSSAMFIAGKPTVAASRLATLTQQALYLGIQAVKPGARLGDIGTVIERHARAHGLSVVRDFAGHGIGAQMHEAPDVVHYRSGQPGITLMPGMTFTIEPMLNAGSHHCRTLADGWTVVTRDRSLSAQWEHTVLVTDTGAEPLTLRPCEREGWQAFVAAQGAAGD